MSQFTTELSGRATTAKTYASSLEAPFRAAGVKKSVYERRYLQKFPALQPQLLLNLAVITEIYGAEAADDFRCVRIDVFVTNIHVREFAAEYLLKQAIAAIDLKFDNGGYTEYLALIRNRLQHSINGNPGPRPGKKDKSVSNNARVQKVRGQKRKDKGAGLIAASMMDEVAKAQAAMDVAKGMDPVDVKDLALEVEKIRAQEEAEKTAKLDKEKTEKEERENMMKRRYQTRVIDESRKLEFDLPTSKWMPYFFLLLSCIAMISVPFLLQLIRHIVRLIMLAIPFVRFFAEFSFLKATFCLIAYVLFYGYAEMTPAINKTCAHWKIRAPFTGPFHEMILITASFVPNLRILALIPKMINVRVRDFLYNSFDLLNPFNAYLRKGMRRYRVVSVPTYDDFVHTYDGRFQSQKYTDFVNMPLYVDVEIIDMSTIWRVFFPHRYTQKVSLQLVQELRAQDIVSPQYLPSIVKDRMATRCARAVDVNITTEESLSLSDVRLGSLDLAYALYLKNRHEDKVKASVFTSGDF